MYKKILLSRYSGSHQGNTNPSHSANPLHFTPTKMAVVKKSNNNNVIHENVEKMEPSYTAGRNVE